MRLDFQAVWSWFSGSNTVWGYDTLRVDYDHEGKINNIATITTTWLMKKMENPEAAVRKHSGL
ncbi:MAG: hypothetical protein R2792_03160 [Saprospiraceae bacterium]